MEREQKIGIGILAISVVVSVIITKTLATAICQLVDLSATSLLDVGVLIFISGIIFVLFTIATALIGWTIWAEIEESRERPNKESKRPWRQRWCSG